MRLTCRNDAFPLLSHEAGLDLIVNLGFESHELLLVGGSGNISLEQVRGDIAGWAGRLDERISSRGLDLADVFVIPWTDFATMSANHPDSAERERGRELFRDMLELIVRLGCPGLTMLPGTDWPGETHAASMERSARELEERAREAQERGVRFGIEPHLGSVLVTPADIAQLCELAPTLSLTLDYGHYTASGHSDDELEPLLARTGHFHARPAAPGHLQTSLRNNTIDFERAIDKLNALGYDGCILVEYLWAEPDPRMDAVDILTETSMLRDRLEAKFRNEPWTYPVAGWTLEDGSDA